MDRLFNNLFNPDHPDSLGTNIQLRAFELFTVFFTLKYAWEWGFYMLRLSDVVLPLGIANYLDVSIFFGDLAIVNTILISALCLVPFFLKKGRWFYFLAFLLFHLHYAIRFSQGEIPHSSNLVGFSLLGLGLGDLFFRNIRQSRVFAFGFTIFFIGLGYTSAAISKLVASGIGWVSGQHLWLWIGEKSIDVMSRTGSFELNWLQELALADWWIATAILTFGLLTEFFGFLFWWKWTRPFATLFLLGMHIGIDLAMNIFFLSFLIQLFIMGFPWYHAINYALQSQKSIPKVRAIQKLLLY